MGIPDKLRSDNGPPFQGHQFKQFCEQFGIQHIKTTPEWPQANGKIENFNRNLRKLIQKVFASKSDWNTELNRFMRAYRNAPQCSSLVPPAELIFIHANSSKLPIKVNDLRTIEPLIKYKIIVRKNGSIEDLCRALEQYTQLLKQPIAVCDVYNSRIFHLYDQIEPVSNIREKDEIYAYQLSANYSSQDYFKFYFYLKSKRYLTNF